MTTTAFFPAGVNVDQEDEDQLWTLGQIAFGNDGSKWVYAKQIALAAGDVVAIAPSTYAVAKLTKALADAGNKIAVAQATKTVSYYGWFLLLTGSTATYKVKGKNGCAPSVTLYTSATAGVLDDTSASQTKVAGIFLVDTATSSCAAEECNIVVEPHI